MSGGIVCFLFENSSVSGWLLHFFDIYTPISMSSIPLPYVCVPIHFESTSHKNILDLVGGFGGAHFDSTTQSYTPCISLCIYHDGNKSVVKRSHSII